MKKVIIRFFSTYSLIGKCHIIIFNKRNEKVYDKYIQDNKVEIYLNKGVYKVFLIPCNIYTSILSTSFIVTEKTNYFNFYLKKPNISLKITATLVDNNYKNLPIERGEINLWQDHIQ